MNYSKGFSSRAISVIKFFAIAIIGIVTVVGIVTSFIDSTDISAFFVAAAFILALMSLHIFYLIKTAIWNWKGNQYSVSSLLIIGLIIHFILSVLFLSYSYFFSPDNSSRIRLFLSSLPFSLIAIAIGVYDSIKFYHPTKELPDNKEDDMSA